MFGKDKLKSSIFLGYLFPVICLIGLASAVYSHNKNTLDRQAETHLAQTTITQVDELALGISRMGRNARGYIVEPENPQTYKESYQKGVELFHKTYVDLENQIKDTQLREQVSSIVASGNQTQEISDKIFTAVDAGKIADAKVIAKSLHFTKMEEQRDEILKKLNQILEKKNQEEADDRNFLILLVVGGTVLSTVVIIIIALWLSDAIAKPLNAKIAGVVDVAEKISKGDLTLEVEGLGSDKDEVGRLIAAFRGMTQNLNQLIRQVRHSGIQVTTSATQIAASGKQLEASVTEQVASTNQVLATAKEIAATSTQLVMTMDEVTNKSQTTATTASNNQKALVRMETTMRQLTQATSSISKKLGIISDKANNISSVVTTITKVAEQTNLLSLNAAIEAEKAGEYGRGFAVVAREIRRLADQTAVATLDIESIVKEMQTAVYTGVSEMAQFTKEVSLSVEDVNNITAQITKLIEEVQALTPRFKIVNQGMEVQSQGAEQITQAMSQLSETSSQTAHSLREINNAIQQLNSAAQSLRQEVSRFHLHD